MSLVINNNNITDIAIGNREIIRISDANSNVLWEKTVQPTITYVKSITEDADYTQSQWDYTHCIDTGVPHTTSTTTVRIKYTPKDTYSDRMVGYFPSDSGCSGDDNDFRIFSYSGGSFDYKTSRQSNIGVFNQNTYYDLTIGDNFVYDNINETYLYQGSTVGSVPSQGCHIFVDVSTLYVDEVIITDGNTTLFDGKAAYDSNGHIGLYDTVSDTMKYNPNLTMTYQLETRFYFEARENNSVLTWPYYSTPTSPASLTDVEFSIDGVNWTDCDTQRSCQLNAGEKVFFKKVNNRGKWQMYGQTTSMSTVHPFFRITSGSFNVGGKLSSLLFNDQTDDLVLTGDCGGLFCQIGNLVDASQLDINVDFSQTQYAFKGAFFRCYYLVNSPSLLSTNLSQGCYQGMYEDDSNLVTPQNLPALTVPRDAYGVMYDGCSLLDNVTVGATSWDIMNSVGWLASVAATGTFTKPSSLVVGTGTGEIPDNSTNGIPTGWTVVSYTPTLPAPTINFENAVEECWDGSAAGLGYANVTASYESIQNATFYIRYCLDGGDITQESWVETNSVTITDSLGGDYIVQAKATKSGWNNSTVAETIVTILPSEQCPAEPDCTDCNYWSDCGYESYEDCQCQQYGEECGLDPCQECYDACEGDPDCEAECDSGPCGGGDEPDPCEGVDCSDCSNWDNECCGYESYEDCDCQNNGNCPEEEEPEE